MHIFYNSYLHVTYTYIESRMINKNINNMFNIDDNNNNICILSSKSAN